MTRIAWVAAAFPDAGDPERRRQWLETVATACERVLIRDAGDTQDADYAELLGDVAELLARVRAELDWPAR
jgi:hypothetical protein